MLKYLATVFETKLGECETKFVSCILEWNHLIFHIKLNKEKIIFVFFFVICQVNIRFYIYSYPSSILVTNQESRLLFKRWLVWGGGKCSHSFPNCICAKVHANIPPKFVHSTPVFRPEPLASIQHASPHAMIAISFRFQIIIRIHINRCFVCILMGFGRWYLSGKSIQRIYLSIGYDTLHERQIYENWRK